MVWSKIQGTTTGLSAGDFLDWKEQNTVVLSNCGVDRGQLQYRDKGAAASSSTAMRATPGWFSMQGMPFLMGRDFRPEEGIPGGDHAVILTHKLWNRLGANRKIVGTTHAHQRRALYGGGRVRRRAIGDRFDFQLAVPLAFRPEQINHDLSLAAGDGADEAGSDACSRRGRIWMR